MLTIEPVALLRRSELFAGTADRVLAGIARVLEEVVCPAGAVIMEAGAVEDWLFVVEHGEVEVIRADRRVHMGAGSVVGELAVLDARPRSAPVVALSPVLADRLLRRFGVRLGLVANPIAVLAVATVSVVTGAVAGSATTVFFVLVCSAQVADIALTDGTTRTSIVATYQALAPAERLAAQTSVEAAGEPAAIATVGGLVLIFSALGLGIVWLAVATAVLGLLWLAVAVLCHREYGRRLRDSLARRDWIPRPCS